MTKLYDKPYPRNSNYIITEDGKVWSEYVCRYPQQDTLLYILEGDQLNMKLCIYQKFVSPIS